MTKTAALSRALLNGEVVSILDGFNRFAITNCPREISNISKKFKIQVTKTSTPFKSLYGQTGYYFKYRLNKSLEYNKIGIELMETYVKEQSK